MTAKPVQLTLGVALDKAASFDNFLALEPLNHRQAVDFLTRQFCRAEGESFGYLWGAAESGISHLLQACCHRWFASGLTAQYLPLSEFQDHSAEQLLEGMERLALVCLDDIQVIAQDDHWERGVFQLYNRINENGGQLLVGGHAPPRELGICLPDLESRFSWGPVFHLLPPGEDEKHQILQFRAKRLGISLPDEVVRYLLNHYRRGLSSQMAVLAQLDRASLQQQRRITIPFVKEVCTGQ